jgi:arylsulfatase A-like enzyme
MKKIFFGRQRLKHTNRIILPVIIILIGIASGWYLLRPAKVPCQRIILIIADTLRADHMGCYGYSKDTTPNIDRFSKDCLVFDRAYSPIPFTPSAHMSLFTSLHVGAHGFYDNYSPPLSPVITTLPEILEGDGYYTIGVVSNLYLNKDFGFSRGFKHYLRFDDSLTIANRINREADLWMDRMLEYPDQKSFLFLHYYDPHSDSYQANINRLPYYAPPEFIERFCSDPELSLFYQEQVGSFASQYLVDLNENDILAENPVRNSIISLYDAGLASFDSQIGALFSSMKEKGLYEDSLIIFTSDHGEEFQEHGQFIHNQTYEENIRIPLLVKFPGKGVQPGRIEAPVGLIDIMPTILEYLDIPVGKYFQGRSFLDAIQGSAGEDREIFSRKKLFRHGDIYSLTGRRYKLIYNTTTGEKDLYDLLQDPGEKNNTAEEFPEITEKFTDKIKAIVIENQEFTKKIPKESGHKALSPEEIRKLKALGYLGK